MAYIRIPFADSGDKSEVPVAAQSDGSVSYAQGYPLAYSLNPETDANAKRIERQEMNQLFNDMSTAIQEMQTSGVKPYITADENGGSAFSYGNGALVSYNGAVYQSLKAANTSLPTVTGDWALAGNQVNTLPVSQGFYSGDLNALPRHGIFSTTTAATNTPVSGAAGILEYYVRSGGSEHYQSFHVNGATNRHFVRTGSGTAGNISWAGWKELVTADNSPGRLLNQRVFTSNGPYTPTPGTNSIIVEMVGGGGASLTAAAPNANTCSFSSGGSSGAYIKFRLRNVPASVDLTVPPAAGTNGNGGDTSFGPYAKAPGGRAGFNGTTTSTGIAGGVTGGDMPTVSGGAEILSASAGSPSTYAVAVNAFGGAGGNGGNSVLGSGGLGNSNGPGNPAGGYGGGGGGSFGPAGSGTQPLPGGAGGRGVIIVWEYS